jgi:hypothetical protein
MPPPGVEPGSLGGTIGDRPVARKHWPILGIQGSGRRASTPETPREDCYPAVAGAPLPDRPNARRGAGVREATKIPEGEAHMGALAGLFPAYPWGQVGLCSDVTPGQGVVALPLALIFWGAACRGVRGGRSVCASDPPTWLLVRASRRKCEALALISSDSSRFGCRWSKGTRIGE